MIEHTFSVVDGKAYARLDSVNEHEPVSMAQYWALDCATDALPLGTKLYPVSGQLMRCRVDGAERYVYTVERYSQFVRSEPIPPPKRCKQSRWLHGRWEKLTAKGWKAA